MIVDKRLKDMTLKELSQEQSTQILQRFMEEGGKGFQGAVFQAMQIALKWKEEQSTTSNKPTTKPSPPKREYRRDIGV